MAAVFQSLRTEAISIARSIEAWPDDGSDRLARVKAIADTLSETFHDRIPGEPDWALDEFEVEYLSLRRRWNDITLSDRALKPIEMELEAAIALIMTHSEVIAYFEVNENCSYFEAIFNFDVIMALKRDAESYEWFSNRQRELARFPIYALAGALALLIGIVDTIGGNSSVGNSIFNTVGIICLISSYVTWREFRMVMGEVSALKKKWGNMPPTMYRCAQLAESAVT